jgi:hypothetical protein
MNTAAGDEIRVLIDAEQAAALAIALSQLDGVAVQLQAAAVEVPDPETRHGSYFLGAADLAQVVVQAAPTLKTIAELANCVLGVYVGMRTLRTPAPAPPQPAVVVNGEMIELSPELTVEELAARLHAALNKPAGRPTP